MGLPKLQRPQYHLILPSTKKEILYMPYTVGEEKLLLMASASGEEKDYLNAIRQCVENCIIAKPPIDVATLPVFDLEYLMLNIRAKSVGEIVTIRFNGIKDTDCKKCKQDKEVQIDLTKVKVNFPENYTNKIMVTDEIGVCMKYPCIKTELAIANKRPEDEIERIFADVIHGIDYIYEKDSITRSTDVTPDELKAFVESLPQSVFDKLLEFQQSIPTISHDIVLDCNACQRKQTVTLSGYTDFFD